MSEIKNIIIVNTYFHIRQLKYLDFIKKNNSLVFYGHYIKKEQIENMIDGFKLIPLPKYSFSRKQFTNNLFRSILNTRKLIKKFSEYIDNNINIENDKKYNLIIFTEKDLLNQLLLTKLYKKKNIDLISVDEGIGHYRISNTIKEKIINFLYNIFSLIFFQFKFNYVVALGRDPRLDAIYLRFPELADYTKNIQKIFVEKKNYNINKKNGLSILIFTTPLSEDNYIDIKDEKKIIQDLCEMLISKGYKVEIKPHPREVTQKYNYINEAKIIQNNLQVDDLELYKYTYIVNFGSSIILELYEMGYDLNRVITFNYIFDIDLYPLFKQTYIIENSNQFIKEIINEN